MDPKTIRYMLHNDDKYIYNKRYSYNVDKLLQRYPQGIPDHIIAQSLLISEEDLESVYQEIVVKLRTNMGVEPQ